MSRPPPLLHIIGAGPWQVPTIRRAKALGLRVLVTDGYAERPGYAVADLHEVVDIFDQSGTLAVARRHGVHGVLCDTTDNGVMTAALVADRMGLPGVGLAGAHNCTDKARMTACAQAAGLAVPLSCNVGSRADLHAAASAVGFPLLVKPVDSQSGRGVGVVGSAAGLSAAFDAAVRHSRSGALIVQRFVRGVEIIVDMIVVDRTVHHLGIACKTPDVDNPTISSRITYRRHDLPAPATRIEAVAGALVSALAIRQGLVHAEFIVDGEHIVPIDVGARGGGVMIYSHALPRVSGVDVMKAAIDLALGRPADLTPIDAPRSANIEFLRAPTGRVTTVEGVERALAMPGVEAVHLNIGPGSQIEPWTHKDHRPGFVIATAADAESAVAASQRAAACIDIRVTSSQEQTCP